MESIQGQGDKDNPGSNGPILSLPLSWSPNLIPIDYSRYFKMQDPYQLISYVLYLSR